MAINSEHLSIKTKQLISGLGTWVEGEWLDTGGEEIEVVDPSTGDIVTSVKSSGIEGVARAVSSARKAFDDGRWSKLSNSDRSSGIRRLAAVLDSRRDEFAELGVVDVGTPITLSKVLHGTAPISFFNFYADAAIRGPHGGYEEGLGLSYAPVTAMSTLYREPVGVVAAITAYNFPLLITAFKVGGALATGCTVVLMPSPRTLTASLAFMKCVEEADLPVGIVNLVTGQADVGQALSESAGVDMVTFTGSVAVGRKVMEQAARGLKKVVLELGGKSPNILLPGVNVERVVRPSILRFTRNAGQGCGATTRTLVPRDQYEAYAAAARDVMTSLVVGDPWDPKTDIGPLISADHRERVQGYVDRAISAGATVEAGENIRLGGPGFFMNPMLLGGVDNSAEVCQEELFGPVGVLLPYDTVDEAVAIANGTRFGLNANVWGDTEQALTVARRLKAGTVTINGGGADRPDAPWPSAGESGIGVDRGMDGFREFFNVRHVQYAISPIGK